MGNPFQVLGGVALQVCDPGGGGAGAFAGVNAGDVFAFGDSLAYGGGFPGGYRTAFYNRLTADGYAMRFAGFSTANASPELAAAGQGAQEGHPGYGIGTLDAGLTAVAPDAGGEGYFLSNDSATGEPVDPSVVLVNAGTNDMNAGIGPYYDVRVILDQFVRDLAADRPRARIYVAELLPALDDPSLTQADRAWDDYLPAEMAILRADGIAVAEVPLYDQFANADGTARAANYDDVVHPNEAGYAVMGNAFAAAVEGDDPAGPVPSPGPAVPEPAGVAGVALAAGAVAGRRRMRRSRSPAPAV